MIHDAAVRALAMQALFELQGRTGDLTAWAGEALPGPLPPPGRVLRRGEDMAIGIAPERWLLRAPLAREAALIAGLRPDAAPDAMAIETVSDSLAFLTVTGPAAAAVMAVASPLDLHPATFGPDAAGWTKAFGLRALILPVPEGFELAVDSSHADYALACLRRIVG